MLKIKDNVDLKELEKFGFEYDEELSERDDKCYSCTEKWQKVLLFENDRDVRIYETIWDSNCQFVNNVLYDLIKADLVEKVESEE